MRTINITCDTCHKKHEVIRTPEIPEHVVSLGCNWCPSCEDKADDYYDEWYNESDDDIKHPDPIPDNQLCLPFAMNEILNGEVEEKELTLKI